MYGETQFSCCNPFSSSHQLTIVINIIKIIKIIIACLESSTYEVNSGGMDAHMSLYPA